MIMDVLRWIAKGDLDLMITEGILRIIREDRRRLATTDASQQIIRDNLGHTLHKDHLSKDIRNQDEGRLQVHRAQGMGHLSRMGMEIPDMMIEAVMAQVRFRQ